MSEGPKCRRCRKEESELRKIFTNAAKQFKVRVAADMKQAGFRIVRPNKDGWPTRGFVKQIANECWDLVDWHSGRTKRKLEPPFYGCSYCGY